MYPKMFAVAILVMSFFVKPAFAAQIVDINNADVATIAENLNGIGEAKARAIVAYRAEHGVFIDEQDLIKVKGIGTKLVERNRSLISFGKNVSVKKPVVASSAIGSPSVASKKKADQSSSSTASANSSTAVSAGTQPQLSN